MKRREARKRIIAGTIAILLVVAMLAGTLTMFVK